LQTGHNGADEQLLQSLRLDGSYSIPITYQEDFSQAELAFVYQRVYDPAEKVLVTLNKLPAAGLPSKDEKWVGM
jgi:exonuclease-1